MKRSVGIIGLSLSLAIGMSGALVLFPDAVGARTAASRTPARAPGPQAHRLVAARAQQRTHASRLRSVSSFHRASNGIRGRTYGARSTIRSARYGSTTRSSTQMAAIRGYAVGYADSARHLRGYSTSYAGSTRAGTSGHRCPGM